jgi:hypothetical protein
MNTYKIKKTIDGIDYLEMIDLDGTISSVPMVAGNADYEAYLNPQAEQSTPILPPE